MTQFSALLNPEKSKKKPADGSLEHILSAAQAASQAAVGQQSESSWPLTRAVENHVGFESASFHTPGHKGRSAILRQSLERTRDLTELPGLDELARPSGVLRDLEKRAAALWQCGDSIISVGGASSGLMAALLAAASRGREVLVPRNAHRSILNGLVLSGLVLVWYEPIWDQRWGVWGNVSPVCVEQLLSSVQDRPIAAMIVVSPTYAGAVSDLEPIASMCHSQDIALIVDEAHGAHFLADTAMPASALEQGADVVVHSLHKTLSGLTQTGIVHVSDQSLIPSDQIRGSLNLVQTSSPSYLLMSSLEEVVESMSAQGGRDRLANIIELSARLRHCVERLDGFELYKTRLGTDPAHVFVGLTDGDPRELYDYLVEHKVFPEALLGSGVLFMLGVGSEEEDIDLLVNCMDEFQITLPRAVPQSVPLKAVIWRPSEIEQVMTPRQACLMPSQVVSVKDAIGRIAAESVAPCPPGIPVCAPGQRVQPHVLEVPDLKFLRVVIE